MTVAIFFAYLMRALNGRKLSIINAVWQIIGLIIVTLLGIMLFKDKLNVYQWVGITLAIISLLLLIVGEKLKKE